MHAQALNIAVTNGHGGNNSSSNGSVAVAVRVAAMIASSRSRVGFWKMSSDKGIG